MMSTKQPPMSRKNRTYKRWVIVLFTESNDYSVVPVNWLILPTTLELTALNISVVELCRWPPFNVTSVELANANDPEDSWSLYKIKILSSKLYANFKEAWHQRVEIESSATENECEVLKKKKKNRQRSSSEDDSDFEDCSLSVTPISKKLKKDVPITFTELLERNSDEELNCELESVSPLSKQIAASSSVSYMINDDIHKWIVGYFEGENKYSVIPESWLIVCGKMYISKWPKSGNIPKMISECKESDIDWPTYPVKIVSRFYNNYKEAANKEKELFMSASASEPDCIANNLPETSKISRKRTYINLNESNASTSSSTQITPIKIYKPYVGVGDNTTVCSNAPNTTSANYSSADAEMFQSITSALTDVYNGDDVAIEPRQGFFTTFDQISKDNDNQCITTEQNSLNKVMCENITTILAYVKRIDGKLDAMGYNLNTNHSSTNVENDFLSFFPMKTVESLEEIESKLILDTVFEEKLINCVTQIGGTSIHNFIKRVYSRLFTNQLATAYSWTGFRKNKQLQHLKITKIIKDVCMKNFKGTEVEFECNVKNWFKNGSQRQSRQKQ